MLAAAEEQMVQVASGWLSKRLPLAEQICFIRSGPDVLDRHLPLIMHCPSGAEVLVGVLVISAKQNVCDLKQKRLEKISIVSP